MKRRTVLQSMAALPLLGQGTATRTWLGPEYWANPLQDWKLKDGRIECAVAGGDRSVVLLTQELAAKRAPFRMSVRAGWLEKTDQKGWFGFRVGMRSYTRHWKDATMRGVGVNAGVTTDGRLFVGQLEKDSPKMELPLEGLTLELDAEPAEGNTYKLGLAAGGTRVERTVPAEWLTGLVAVVCHNGEALPFPPELRAPRNASGDPRPVSQRGGTLRTFFADWKVEGEKFTAHPERAWGPILWSMYTLSRNVLKLTAQLAPVDDPNGTVELVVGGKTIAKARIDEDAVTARFRVANWDARRDTPFTLRYAGQSYTGTIRHDPVEKNRFLIGALTCQNDMGFPHAEIERDLKKLDPDILFFTGDQIYERVAEYGTQREPQAAARLDYLRKWYLFGWAFGDLMRTIPTVAMPDDHDVYHGNLWGCGGKAAAKGATEQEEQDSGGYKMPARWVNMVMRTQTSHLPDPPDPAPVEQGISVYFTDLVWGGISFAILEDRKWKSAPKALMPEAKILNGWPQNPQWDARRGDVPGAELLGPRQERFLDAWSRDWKGGVWLKVAVSDTIFCNVATLPKDAMIDSVVPRMAVPKVGEYIEGDKPAADHDSNGWPQTPRTRAIRLMRQCLAVHVAGDQHLPSTVQYGIDEFGDGPWAICTPAISNLFPRRFCPPGGKMSGDFHDAFGNMMSVAAVANPAQYGVWPEFLNNRAPGFGSVEVFKDTRKMILTNHRRWDGQPFAGWPVTIHQKDNGLPKGPYFLPGVTVDFADPVVEVTNSEGGLEYCFRIQGKTFRPPVRREGRYTVRVFDPDKKKERVFGPVAAVRG
ncbi:MAG: alkaline phosphatase D family protein [Bryobacter sp.]|nr:alkaline phosphatase D family protein [Bryobacter sp.]